MRLYHSFARKGNQGAASERELVDRLQGTNAVTACTFCAHMLKSKPAWSEPNPLLTVFQKAWQLFC